MTLARRWWTAAGLACAFGAAAALAQPAATPAQREAKQRAYFTDTPLLAQDGRALKFHADVLKDQLVLINFVFTECGDACPLITQKLLAVRQILGPQAAQVRFVSISIDPERDTPQTMTQFARKQGALDPQWLWLTGAKSNVDLVTKKLGAWTDDPQNHFTGLIVGNVRTDRWLKIRPDAPPAAIALQLRQLGELENPIAARSGDGAAPKR